MGKADCDANEALKLEAKVERLEAEAATVCSLLYAAGVPSISEDGYGENVKRLKALLERLWRAERERDESLPTLRRMIHLMKLVSEVIRNVTESAAKDRAKAMAHASLALSRGIQQIYSNGKQFRNDLAMVEALAGKGER